MTKEIEKYIDEILSLIRTKDDLDHILFDISILGDRINYDIISKSGEAEAKKRLLQEKVEVVTSPSFKSFLLRLIEENDSWLLEPGHYKMFQKEINDLVKEIVFFKLITAVELKQEDLQEITQKLRQKMERVVLIDASVDESLVGGAIIKRDNYILDFSLKSKLNRLATDWKKAIEKTGEAHA